jgi:hypothetical protein
VEGSCEPSDSIEGRKFYYLNDYQILKKESAPWGLLATMVVYQVIFQKHLKDVTPVSC